MSNYDSNIDYLEEDQTIDKQQYCCLSFIEPTEETEKHSERFIFNKFLKHLSKNFILTPRMSKDGDISIEEQTMEIEKKEEEKTKIEIEEVTEEKTEVQEEVQEEVVNELENPKVCHKKLFEEYIGFMTVNYADLINKYIEKYGNKTCLRGIKVRGSYRSLEQARERAKQLQQIDQTFNVFVGEVGKWGPFNPININEVSAEYMDEQLNKLVHTNTEQIAKKEQLFNDRKHKLKNRSKNKRIVNKK